MLSEPVTVSCGFLLTFWGKGSCNPLVRTLGAFLLPISFSRAPGWGAEGCCPGPEWGLTLPQSEGEGLVTKDV
jgi:hypothetical protein